VSVLCVERHQEVVIGQHLDGLVGESIPSPQDVGDADPHRNDDGRMGSDVWRLRTRVRGPRGLEVRRGGLRSGPGAAAVCAVIALHMIAVNVFGID
jgi:hypothetical protein